jgi:hypothetical protein
MISPTNKDYNDAILFIISIIGEELKCAETDSGKRVTKKCSQIWQETFRKNADEALSTIYDRIRYKNYLNTINVPLLVANLEKVRLCMGKTTEPFLKIVNHIESQQSLVANLDKARLCVAKTNRSFLKIVKQTESTFSGNC